jgi:nitrite reductase (NADH) small subunit
MPSSYDLGSTSQIPPGEGRNFEVGGRRVAVFRSREGHFFATQAHCPHRGGPLADGLVGGTTLVCPLHEWRFDLVTGKTIGGSCDLETYQIRLGDRGNVVLTLPDSA